MADEPKEFRTPEALKEFIILLGAGPSVSMIVKFEEEAMHRKAIEAAMVHRSGTFQMVDGLGAVLIVNAGHVQGYIVRSPVKDSNSERYAALIAAQTEFLKKAAEAVDKPAPGDEWRDQG